MDPTTVPRKAVAAAKKAMEDLFVECPDWGVGKCCCCEDGAHSDDVLYAVGLAAAAPFLVASFAGGGMERLVDNLTGAAAALAFNHPSATRKLNRARTALLAAHGAAVERATGPGTPSYRLKWLLDELARRFPEATMPLSSRPPEPFYLAAIDNLIETQRSAVEQAREEAVAEFRKRCMDLCDRARERPPKCGHTNITDGCADCACELSRRMGQMEAGAYMTMDEFNAALAARRPNA